MRERRKKIYIVLAVLLLVLILLLLRRCNGSGDTIVSDSEVLVSEVDSVCCEPKADTVVKVVPEVVKRAGKPAASKKSTEAEEVDVVAEPAVEEEIVQEAEEEEPENVLSEVEENIAEEVVEEVVEEEVKAPEKAETVVKEGDPIQSVIAFKTNLLWDLTLAPNLEVEFLFPGDRVSLMAEWWCPWWVTRNNSWCYQMLYGGLEGRYWLGDREKMEPLTGHFFGVYGGGGIFDFERKNTGFQSQFYFMTGLTYGYSFPIHRNLRIETSISIGYFRAEYQAYDAMEDGEFLVWMYDGLFQWVGPTKAKVSLVWTIMDKDRKNGYRPRHKMKEGRR